MYGTRLWTPEWSPQFDLEPHIVYFARDFYPSQVPENRTLWISADSRYKLYVNGRLLQEGPCKANRLTFYRDPCDLSGQLADGINHLAIEVLRFPADFEKRNHSVLRTDLPFLYVDGFCDDTPTDWLCHIHTDITFRSEDTVPAPLHIIEDAKGSPAVVGWKLAGMAQLSSRGWLVPVSYGFNRMKLSDTPRVLTDRPIPLMELTKHSLTEQLFRCLRANGAKELPLNIPAHTHVEIVLDAGELMTGYPVLRFWGGGGSRIRILYAESYLFKDEAGNFYKEDRTDASGFLMGSEDTYIVAGCGTLDVPEEYAPFWYRTFRFIRISMDTGDALTIGDFHYTETGYPLPA